MIICPLTDNRRDAMLASKKGEIMDVKLDSVENCVEIEKSLFFCYEKNENNYYYIDIRKAQDGQIPISHMQKLLSHIIKQK